MTHEQTNKFMQWQYWMVTAQYYAALIQAGSGFEANQGLFEDALVRANYIQQEFEKMLPVRSEVLK